MRMKKKEREVEELSEEEKKALRGSKFAPLPSLPSSSRPQTRLAHPGGPLTTNKAAALAKFLERKLQDPNGLASINPDLLERAVKNAKETILASASSSGRIIKHVDSFGDTEESLEEEKEESSEPKKQKKKNKKKKRKNKNEKDQAGTLIKKPKKKFKF
ncbi:putative OVARIAN TUMOR DOMAIN-containing deubiquitinating enzyme 8 [Humulus lupulus]|uniref:putative OVARIAN TUMOR DOMAIN-containing deubiquitinating enzyme 8 n=1 Tax=Humulus lupulus TaxID=3486 RepID=UPI002B408664|nr:putative OVARIAN TUMOR DOMAIN-containing deubiquitinating enzyme 8 [Humulus lupulus]